MKYMLFGWECYYPRGGMRDLIGMFESVQEAEEHFEKGYIPQWAEEDDEQERRYWDAGQIVNATSLVVEKELYREN